MFYKVNKAALYAFAGISLAAMGGAASADVLVTSSTGNAAREYPRGTRLADNQQLVLGRGDTVVVLTSTGTRRFRGPGRVNLNDSRRLAGNALSRTSSSGVLRRPGAVRTGEPIEGEEYPERTAWQIDIEDSGAVCYISGSTLSLWRPAADDTNEITISRRSDNASQTVIFAAGQVSQDWPSAFAAAPGEEYWINWDGNIVATRITFVQLGVDSEDQVALGAAMHDNNCDGQLDALVTQAEDDAG